MSINTAQLQRLRHDLSTGKMTCADIERRLAAAIDAAYQQGDLALVNACEDLLWELRTGDQPAFSSRNDRYLAAMQEHMAPMRQKPRPTRPFARYAAVCAILVCFLVSITDIPSFDWLSGTSTPDEQQYVIQGHTVDTALLQQSLAYDRTTSRFLTVDWNELVEYLGFIPTVPTVEALGMERVEYAASFAPGEIYLDVQFFAAGETAASAVFLVQHSLDGAETYLLLEQNTVGDLIYVNSHKVYTTKNMGNSSFTWFDDCTAYTLAGKIDYSVGLAIVHEMIGD